MICKEALVILSGLFGLVFAAGMPVQAQTYDVVIEGGRVMDPESKLDAVRSLGIRNGKIAAISNGNGSTPHQTKDPVLMASAAVVQYQFIISRAIDAQKAAVLTVGSIQAGSDNNVIPASALLKINLRWYDEADRKLISRFGDLRCKTLS